MIDTSITSSPKFSIFKKFDFLKQILPSNILMLFGISGLLGLLLSMFIYMWGSNVKIVFLVFSFLFLFSAAFDKNEKYQFDKKDIIIISVFSILFAEIFLFQTVLYGSKTSSVSLIISDSKSKSITDDDLIIPFSIAGQRVKDLGLEDINTLIVYVEKIKSLNNSKVVVEPTVTSTTHSVQIIKKDSLEVIESFNDVSDVELENLKHISMIKSSVSYIPFLKFEHINSFIYDK